MPGPHAQDTFLEKLQVRRVLDRSNTDLERIGAALRDGDMADLRKVLRKHSREIQMVLLAEACELHDRERLNYLTQRNLDRYEPKQKHIQQQTQVLEEVHLIVSELEAVPTDELLERARAISGRRETRQLRVISD